MGTKPQLLAFVGPMSTALCDFAVRRGSPKRPLELRREPQRTDPDLRGASVFERDILNENFDDIRDGASLVASVFL